MKRLNHLTSKEAVFIESLKRTIRNLLQKSGFGNGTRKRIDLRNTVSKQNNNKKQSSTKITPINTIVKRESRIIFLKFVKQKNENKTKLQMRRFI